MKFTRCFLVGMLVSGMVVDSAVARRLFQRHCCRISCVKVCPPLCPAATDAAIENSACQDCASEIQPELVIEELSVPTLAPIPATDSPVDLLSEQLIVPPAPLAVPELSEIPATTPPTPTAVETPAAEVVGGRYSDDKDIFGPPEPEESKTLERAVDPASTDEEVKALFDDPAPSAEEKASEEEASSESSSQNPAQAEPTPEDPEPQPELKDEDLFGPVESDASDEDEEEGKEETDQQPQNSELPVPAESEESYDPFGEGFSDLDDHASVLIVAGGLRSDAERTWTDDTATFQCQARLLKVTGKGVVLRQATGAKLVVPLARLANDDLHFVRLQITALRVVQARDATAERLAVAWAR